MSKVIIDSSNFEGLSGGEPQTIDQLCETIISYHKKAELDVLRRAYALSEAAHSGQIRRSGQPYIFHPVGVAGILAELKLDLATIATGLLHDVVEDTNVGLKEIEEKFGPVIAQLVDGVTKISRMSFRHTHEKQGENIRKMIVAMGKDVRVVLVKLADRLHNMRTLNHMPPDKQMRIAQETLDIYAPLASRLGISSVKIELEDLGFRYVNSEQYYLLAQKVAKKRKEREQYIDDVKKMLADELGKYNFEATVQGRPKHLYSIYKKMVLGNLDYEQVFDVLAFRVLVESVPRCYEVLGLAHSLWKPIPGRFKDFIAMPKINNYQSLHTTVVGPGGEHIEVQIRTHEMHLVAERGIAAHWKYKEKDQVDIESSNRFSWLQDLVQRHQQTHDPDEFLEGIKTDLFESEIYVFTPKGDVMEFPDGATPLDFAYAIHTDVGQRCVAARVNGRLVPLKHKLKNGDSVEVITSKTQQPSKDWLSFCVTTKAQARIRSYIKIEQRKRALTLGQQLLEKAFRKYELKPSTFLGSGEVLKQYLSDVGCPDVDDLYVKVGYGKLMAEHVVDKLAPEHSKTSSKEEPSFLEKIFKSAARQNKKSRSIIEVDGMSDVLVRYARCCTPIPGDPIVGFISRGRGITVHTASCPKSFSMDQDRRVDVQWSQAHGAGMERQARIRVVSDDRQGLLQKMSEAFSAKGINILSAQVRTTRDKKAICFFDVSVKDTSQLYSVMNDLQKIGGILGVTRISQA
ncbi:MAG: bifunctional (p)ppGpp synthetase/guanosine-3',5'-bis(diphosphate) 3'-pyrophosphohydrolase [Pseudomonadota bacterium]|nr:bifunctional (p)ppGpp synthetase/guanosine-3',5'-bis(diphosphate) 3'-pyrophosphohydrolase [Pseudomonadota bacterium]